MVVTVVMFSKSKALFKVHNRKCDDKDRESKNPPKKKTGFMGKTTKL